LLTPTAQTIYADLILQLEEPEEFEHWEKLVRAAEAQEGGLNRNSSPGAIASTRDVYDNLLARFPLFFGFWKKYADLEFTVAGTEAAEMVSFPGSKTSQQTLT
jgi:pre-mRNA-processing factor 39